MYNSCSLQIRLMEPNCASFSCIDGLRCKSAHENGLAKDILILPLANLPSTLRPKQACFWKSRKKLAFECALQSWCTLVDLAWRRHIDILHQTVIATVQLAVDGKVEKSEIAVFSKQLKSHSGRLDVFGLKREFLVDDTTIVSSGPECANGR